MVIVTGYSLFVTSEYDFIFTFANQRFGEGCSHNMHNISQAVSLLVVVQCVTVMKHHISSPTGAKHSTQR